MTVSKWLIPTHSRLLMMGLIAAIVLGGACDCNDDDPDPDPDVGPIEDVIDDDVVDEDVIDDVVDEDVIDDVVDDDVVDDVVDDDVVDDVVDDVDPDPDPVDIPDGMARLQVVHNAADPDVASIDIYFDDDLIIDDFEFRTATPYVDVDADEYEISVAGADSDSVDDALITFDATEFDEGERYLVVANGVLDPDDFDANPDGESIDVSLYIFEDAKEVADDAAIDEMVLFHGATDAPAIDLVANNDITIVADQSYGSFTDGYLTLPQGITVLDLLVSETGDRVNSYQTPSLTGGDTYVALASGFLDPTQNEDAPFEIVVYPTPIDGDRLEAIVLDEAARLQLVHDSIDPATSPADIFVDGERFAEDVEYRSATPFLTYPSGESIDFAITEAGADDADDAVVEATLEFDAGSSHIAVASGVLDPGVFPDNPDDIDTGLALYATDDAREMGDDDDAIDLLVFHGVIDAGDVEVIAEDGPDVTLAEDLSYGDFSDYTAVDAEDDTTIAVLPPDPPPTPLAEYAVDLGPFGGGAALVVLSGAFDTDDDRPPVAAVVVFPDGEVVVIDDDDLE